MYRALVPLRWPVFALLATLAIASPAQFTPGRLAVLELSYIPNGTGGFLIPLNGGAMVIREFTTTGVPGFAVSIPSSGPDMLVQHFNANGAALNRSPSGDQLIFTGYTAQSTSPTLVQATTSSTIPRGIGTLDAVGTYSRPFTTSTFFSGSRIMAATTDGTNYWASGGNSGVCYMGPGPPVAVNTFLPQGNDLAFNGSDLYVSGGNVFKIGNGSPTTPVAEQQLAGVFSTYGIDISPAGDVCYTTNINQIRKWVLAGGIWTNVYSFPSVGNILSIVVDWSAAQSVIYGVRFGPSELYKWEDNGASAAATLLASTSAGAWFGIALTPESNCVVGAPCDDGDPNTIDDEIGSDCICTGRSVRVAVKALLGGATDAGTLLMSDALRNQPLFPLSEPYTALGLPPTGGTTAIAPVVLAITGNNAIVDWVAVELRDPIAPFAIVARRTALIQRDGDIVDLDGTSPLAFPLSDGSYCVAVRHRNHLSVMSAAAFTLTPLTTSVDLTLGSTATYGTDARTTIGSAMALWAGDVTANSELKYSGASNDRDPILVRVGGAVPTNSVPGYWNEDINLDGLVKYTGASNDRDPILVNIGGVVPSNVRPAQIP